MGSVHVASWTAAVVAGPSRRSRASVRSISRRSTRPRARVPSAIPNDANDAHTNNDDTTNDAFLSGRPSTDGVGTERTLAGLREVLDAGRGEDAEVEPDVPEEVAAREQEQENEKTSGTGLTARAEGAVTVETSGSDASSSSSPVPWPCRLTQSSEVYNVPLSVPRAAFVLAAAHFAVFAVDYALYALAGGSGGDVFLRLAEVDDALVRGSQWWRPFTACLVDYGLVQFVVTTFGLFTLGAEAEAVLGTAPFLTLYVLSSVGGGVPSPFVCFALAHWFFPSGSVPIPWLSLPTVRGAATRP